ncbi:adenylyl-sulfate kinase [Nibrella saemangeumensis]|uniref:Adenylyl-sulfate kinase n=1 Tax=Nibrella saemangeumensis TaxID=1084526 RepID=A0ABP8MM16_9BACT
MMSSDSILLIESHVSYAQRKAAMMQEPRLIWLTGLSGSGKSTLALRLEHYLFCRGYKVCILDGDNIRNGLCNDLGFSEEDREENLRRVGETAKLMLDAGLIVIAAFISPYEAGRNAIRNKAGLDRFIEVYVNCTIEACVNRDVKGLYARARNGIIPDFTGISAPYEPPTAPDVVVDTVEESIDESLLKIIQFLESKVELVDRVPVMLPQ